ncbi:hypothetical protein GCM10010967_28100 [Dyadobacter beijingensis]|uniref:HEPN domain-containing protein n=1 Tax=Dyadobacter beijingensis TaxID=365489 RepID=A0ABQ2HYP4_9BACT|nr:hypothetical protein [Dyadobacter beijingensis]GGM93370.1 hypothetical protein GCM10010967_28100 [Dyadobacter beijingensis]
MTNPHFIRMIARLRLKEANILFKEHMFDGAFYLAGYSAELSLKAKISERFGIPNLFDDTEANTMPGIRDIRSAVKTHNLVNLLVFSGLKSRYEEDKALYPHLAKANSLLFEKWSEKARYKPCGFIFEEDIRCLINLLSDQNGLLAWIDHN